MCITLAEPSGDVWFLPMPWDVVTLVMAHGRVYVRVPVCPRSVGLLPVSGQWRMRR